MGVIMPWPPHSPSALIPLASILISLDIVAVVLRFYARRRQKVALLADDWLTLPALLFNIGLAIVFIQDSFIPDTPNPDNSLIIHTSRNQWIILLLFVSALGCIKLSILFLYRRILVIDARDFKDMMNVSTIGMSVLVTIWTIAFFFRYLFACKTHIDMWWDEDTRQETECSISDELYLVLTITDFGCDLITLIIPCALIWRLRLSLCDKLAATAVFGLGAVAVVASLLRMVWAIWEHFAPFGPDFDFILLAKTLFFWNFLEASIGLFAVCIPTLSPLVNFSCLKSTVRNIRDKLSLRSPAKQLKRSGDDLKPEGTSEVVGESIIQVERSFQLSAVSEV